MELTNKILDTALLSELAYLKLENKHFENKTYSLGNITEFLRDNNKDITGIDDNRDEAIIDLLRNYTIIDFKNIPTSFAGLNDIQAMLLKDKDGNTTISFRGTDGISDIAIDALMLQGGYTNQMYSALQWVRDLKSSGMLTGNVTITGHSLGGSLAQLVGYDTGYETYTYNAFALQRNEAIEVLGEKTTDNIINLQLGEDIISGLGSQVGGTGEGIIHDIIDNIGTVVPSAYTKYLDVGNLLLQGSINYIKDTINKSHLGQLVTLFDIDDVSISDLITDHFMSGFSSAFELYRSNNIDLSDIFMTEDIQEINTQLGYILANANMNIDVEGMPKAVEYMMRAVGFEKTDGTKFDSLESIQNAFNEITDITQGATLKTYSYSLEDMNNEINNGNKALLYNVVNLNPSIYIDDMNHPLYSNVNINDYSEKYLEDRINFHYYLVSNSSFLEQDANYLDNDTGIKLQTLRDIPTVIFGSNDETKNETIYTQKTNDRIYAGKGDDTIIAWNGNNLYDGGEGNDTVSYKILQSKEGINVNLSLSTAQAINSTTTDTLVNIENVIGSKYADYITGKDNTTTTLYGGNGNDTLKGGNNSENILLGEDGDDYIYGGITTDEIMLNANKLVMNYLDGGAGKDYLIAGKNANNYLYGGAGNDTLVSTLIGFKNESAGIDYSKGSSYLNGGIGTDTYVVKDYVTIEDEDGLGEIQTKYGNLQDLTMRTYSDGRVLLLKNNPIYVDIESTYNPLAGYTSGAFNTALGNFGTTTTQGMSLTNYELIFKLSKDGNDLILDDLSTNPTVIRIKNYTANSLSLNITQDMFNTLPNYDENNSQTPTPVNPILIGTNEVDTLIGSEVNNTFISNAGDDILKDISGGNDIYKFKKGDGADTIYDIKGNDTIIFDESVLKEDITFSQSEDLKSLIINYSATDSITITNYFDSFSKIENIQLSTGEKLTPEFTTQTIGSNQAENLITGYGNDTISSNQGDDTIKDLNGNDTYTFKVGDGNDIIEDLDGIDKIVFENLSNEDLIFTQKDNNLIINYSTSDSVTILNYFDNTTSNYLEKIAFKNDLETIDASNIITGTVNDDEINGTYFDDVITSNKGNDTLKGSYGNDTYKFSKGDGNNRIYDVKGDDTITFDETINKEDISFSIKDNNLLITYSLNDTVEILDYFNSDKRIENIKLSTGEIVEVTNIDKTLNGTEQNDTLIGSYGNDILIGNDGDDTLTGNVGADKLYGGSGFDTYISNDGDIISDSDNLGKIIFDGQTLSTAIYDESKRVYVSSIGEYSLEDTTLTFINNAGKKLTIENFDKNSYALGINLTNEGRTFSTQTLYSNVLVVDLNKDGFVNTNSLNNSNTYFDITNSNFKNKTQWLDNSDGFLVFDKNSDGIINSSDELFGNLSKSGFQELEELIDLNYDNKIDRKDSMFHQLKVWQDLNNDGISTSNELFDLIDVGISSINLNTSQRDVIDTNITIDEASTYKTLNGTNELIANVKLNYDPNKSLSVNSNFENKNIDQIIQTLPKLRGYGIVENSTIAYTLNEDLKNLATQIITPLKLSENFDKFLSSWSGYDELINNLKDKYDVDYEITLNQTDKKMWIIEAFTGNKIYSQTIEENIESYISDLANSEISYVAPITQIVNSENTLLDIYSDIKFRYESSYAVQSVFKDIFENTNVNLDDDVLEFENNETIKTNILNYLNDSSINIEEKAYLAKVIYEINASSNAYIPTDDFKTTISNEIDALIINSILEGYPAYVYENSLDSYTKSGSIIVSSKTNDNISAVASSIILANKGDDNIHSSEFDDVFIYRKGDGSDIIYDEGGVDTIYLSGINKSEISLEKNGFDLKIKLNDTPTDSILIKEFFKGDHQIENIIFADSKLDYATELLSLQATQNNDFVELNDEDNVFDALGGNDTVYGLGGNDTLTDGLGDDKLFGNDGNDTLISTFGNNTLYGGSGDDTYIYKNTSGFVTIKDTSGTDTLKLADVSSVDNIFSRVENNDLKIYILNGTKPLNELTNVITINDWKNNQIENILLSNGNKIKLEEIQKATINDDYLVFDNSDTNIDALAGNDIIITGSGNDTVLGNDGNDEIITKAGDDYVDGGAGNDTIDGGTGNDTLLGNSGNDILLGNTGNDTLDGGEGDDKLDGGADADTLTGGRGNDTLIGGSGDDKYIYNRGDGVDFVQDVSGTDTLVLKDGITKSDIIIKTSGNGSLTVALKETGVSFENLSNKIVLENWLDRGNRIENIELSNGEKIKLIDYLEITDGNDTIFLDDFTNTVDAKAGDDTVITGYEADTVSGGIGNDKIFTSTGNDTLVGGEGNDLLYGGLGNDTYKYGENDGVDVIHDSGKDNTDSTLFSYENEIHQSGINAGNDTLEFTSANITKDNIIVKAEGTNLVIGIKEDGVSFLNLQNRITLKNWLDKNHRIEQIKFANGEIISPDLLQIPTEENDYLIYGDNDLTIDLLDGNDIAYFGDGNNNINLNDGDNIITLGSGNNTIISGDGKAIISSGNGKNTITTGLSDDELSLGGGDNRVNSGAGDDIVNIGAGENIVNSGSGNDIITSKGTAYSQTEEKELNFNIGGTSANYTIKGKTTNFAKTQTIDAGSGNDIVKTGLDNSNRFSVIGNDVISGGSGDDELYAGLGNDIYVFSKDNGIDIIVDQGVEINAVSGKITSIDAGMDTIRFEEGITIDDIIVKAVRSGSLLGTYDSENGSILDEVIDGISYDLVIALKEEGKEFNELQNKMILKNWTDKFQRIENLELFDGTPIYWDEVHFGTDESEYLIYDSSSQNVNAKAGNDQILTESGNDTIDGGSGDDIIVSQEGDDKLIGGSGNDNLYGGKGDDVYVYNKGDGNDLIYDDYKEKVETNTYGTITVEYKARDAGNDTLKFGIGITQEDLSLKQYYYDLLVYVKNEGSDDSRIIIKDWFKEYNNIETFEFSDGSILSSATIASKFVPFDIENAMYSQKNALMMGENGDDTYVYNRGDFEVVIDDFGFEKEIATNAGRDTLYLNGEIYKDDVKFFEDGNNLVLKIKPLHDTYEEYQDVVIIKNWRDENKGIEQIIFSDGETLNIDKNATYETTIYELQNKQDSYVYGNENNTIDVYAQNSRNYYKDLQVWLDSDNNPDTEKKMYFQEDLIIYANGGDDYIKSGEGNDTLSGGKGDDTLLGGEGNDTYIFNKGDGKDIISETSGLDTLKFEDSITKDDLIIYFSDKKTVIAIKEVGKTFEQLSDKITINHDNKTSGQIEYIEFANGLKLSLDEVVKATNNADNFVFGDSGINIELLDGADILVSGLGNDIVYAGSGDDLIKTNEGNDQIFAQDGNDIVYSGNGNDELYGGAGNDKLYGGNGNDILDGGTGDDILDGGTVKDDTDIFIFKKGYGKDTILNINATDIIKIDNNIVLENIEIRVENNDLILALKAPTETFETATDKLTIKNFQNSGLLQFSKIEYIDGRAIPLDKITTNSDLLIFKEAVTIDSLDGNDFIITSDKNDNITSNSGNNTIYAGAGDNIINTGNGNDTIVVKAGNSQINSGAGDDIITSSYGQNIIYGGAGNDTIKDSFQKTQEFDEGLLNDNDIIYGGDGDDIIEAGYGNDKLYGGSGNDRISALSGNNSEDANEDDELYGEEGNDTLIAGYGKSKLYGGVGNDILYAGSNDNLLDGGEGNDKLYGSQGIDTLLGGEGNDEIYDSGNSADIINGGKGDDILSAGIGADKYSYKIGDGKDIIKEIGTDVDTIEFDAINKEDITFIKSNNNLILKIDDNNQITIENFYSSYSQSRVEVLSFNNGLQTVDLIQTLLRTPTINNDYLEFTVNDDNINALAGDDIIYANIGNDTIYGADGNDTIYGEEGNDKIYGGTGNDILDGGKGYDEFYFAKNDGTDTIYSQRGDTLVFTGNITKDNLSILKDGNNLVIALNYGDTIVNDKLILKDFYIQSLDSRIKDVKFTSNGETVDLFTYLLNQPTQFDDYLEYKEGHDNIDALGGNDILYAGAGNDIIRGNSGNDIIYGGSDNDRLYGDDGDDIIYGESGFDSLYGGAGNDILYSGTNDNTLDGGAGSDILVLSNGSNTIIYGLDYGLDTVKGFGTNDKIILNSTITSKDDLTVKLVGNDLLIAIKEENKSFEELSNILTIENYLNSQKDGLLQISDTETYKLYELINNIATTGDDHIELGNEDDVIDSLAGNDYINARAGDNTILSNEGNNTIYSLGGNDTITTGLGDDFIDAGNGRNTINAGDGKNTIYTGINNDTITVGEGTNNINAGDGDNIITTGNGKNSISTGNGKDNITTGSANDYISSGAESDEIHSNEGNDTIYTSSGEDIIYSGSGNDYINSGSENDIIYAQDGDDTIYADYGDDTIYAGSGNDYINAGYGADKIYSGSGNDTINAGAGYDIIYYNRGDENDVIEGNELTTSFNTIRFGSSISKDNITFEKVGNDLKINILPLDASIVSDTITLKGFYLNNLIVERLEFDNNQFIEFRESTNSIDYLVFDQNSNNVVALAGDDYINTKAGNDIINAGAGNDIIDGGEGDDIYYYKRGDGIDTIYDISGTDIIRIISEEQGNILRKKVGNDLVIALDETNVEFESLTSKIYIKDFFINSNKRIELIELVSISLDGVETVNSTIDLVNNNLLVPLTDEDDIVEYGDEDNFVDALGGNDNIKTNGGDDYVFGNTGNDIIYTLNGDDVLEGGKGNDTLVGGTGNDRYIFNIGDGTDTIIEENTDFNNSNTLEFGQGILKENLIFTKIGNDLKISLTQNSTDTITIRSYFTGFSKIDYIQFSNGGKLDIKDNIAPQINSIGTQIIDEDSVLKIPLTIIDENPETLKYEVSSSKGTVTIEDNNLVFTPNANFYGTTTINFKIIDEFGYEVINNFNVTVNSVNDVPVLKSKMPSFTASVDDYFVYDFSYHFSDIENDTLSYELSMKDGSILPSWINLNSSTGKISGIPSSANISNLDLELKIIDKNNGFMIQNINIDVIVTQITYGTDKDDLLRFQYEPEGLDNNIINALGGNDTIYTYGGNDIVNGGLGNDNLYGGEGNDILNGDLGNDTLHGENGDDILTGGAGNDNLYGGAGNDKYIYAIGDGIDYIMDASHNEIDIIEFQEGILKENLIFQKSGDYLYIRFNIEGMENDYIRITYFYDYLTGTNVDYYKIDKLEFVSDSENNITDFKTYIYETASENADYLVFPDETDSDNVDVVDGLAGNDTIQTFDGDDIITGGKGDDTLYGGIGNDKYIYSIGDGIDTIYDYYSGVDIIEFQEGILKENLIYTRNGNNLELTFNIEGMESDKIIIQNYYDSSDYYKIEKLEFISDSENNIEDLSLIALRMPTENADYLQYEDLENSDNIDVVNALGGNDTIYTYSGNDIVNGGLGNDNLYGGEGNDILNGDLGNDTLHGENGDDILTGGAGNDNLYGGAGNDKYIYAIGDGIDYIMDASHNEIDIIEFQEGILKENLIFQKSGDYLYIRFNIEGMENDYIRITYFYDYLTGTNVDYYKIDKLEFVSDSENNITDFKTYIYETASENADYLVFPDETDSDNVDVVDGLAGNDTIQTFDGDDIITGGKGDDTLYGGIGNDKYIYSIGDGIDTIYDYYSGVDIIEFQEGILKENLIYTRNGNNLELTFNIEGMESDKIIIQNYYDSSDYYKIEKLEFISDSENNIEDLSLIALRMPTENADYLQYEDLENSDNIDVVNALGGNDTIYTYSGNDIVNGGLGNDNLYGGEGNDILNGDLGNDTLHGENGDDILTGGAGNDNLYGGAGNDKYIYAIGDGIDYIMDASHNEIDIIEFQEGILKENLIFQKSGDYLYIRFNIEGMENDYIRITYFYDYLTGTNVDYYKIDKLEFVSDSENNITDFKTYIYETASENADYLVFPDETDSDNVDVVDGLAGNDTIQTFDGDDIITGGKGDDTLYGGIGNDKYIYSIGDGIDTIYDYYSGVDIIEFQEGILKENLIYTRNGNNLELTFNIEGMESDKIIITNYYDSSDYYKIEKLEFTSDSENNIEDLKTLVYRTPTETDNLLMFEDLENSDNIDIVDALGGDDTIYTYSGDDIVNGGLDNDRLYGGDGNDTLSGDDGDDYLYGQNGDDTLSGNAGNDRLYGDVGDDTLLGGEGNDILYGQAGNNTLLGGEGNDTLYGENSNDILAGNAGTDYLYGYNGDDTYVYNIGDGINYIYEEFGIDKLIFGEGISKDNLIFTRNVSNLEITFNLEGMESDKIYIDKFYYYETYEQYKIESIEFESDSSNNIADLKTYVDDYLKSLITGPIVLDLNKNSITSTTLETSNVYFDYDGDGIKEKTAWAEKSDALLVLDTNYDGKITTGAELFGDYTLLTDGSKAKDGYEALAQYDENGDGIIDKNDSIFSSLKLWQDKNSDGITDAYELTSIQLSNITAVYLFREDDSEFYSYEENGNIITNQSQYLTSSNDTGIVRDVWFKYDPSDTLTIHDKFVSSNGDEEFSGEEGNDTYIFSLNNGNDVIVENDTSFGNDKIQFLDSITSDKLLVEYDKATNGLIIGINQDDVILNTIYELEDRILIKNWFEQKDQIEQIEFDDGTIFDVEDIYNKLLSNKEYRSLEAKVLNSGDTLEGGNYNDILYGSLGNETLIGNLGNDYLYGDTGNDILIAGSGHDTLWGGIGDDYSDGGDGNDYYIYNIGDGNDIIKDSSGFDIIKFENGITKEDLTFTMIDNDLLIEYSVNDSILIKNYSNSLNKIENIEFFDETIFSIKMNPNTAPVLDNINPLNILNNIGIVTGQITSTDIDVDSSVVYTTNSIIDGFVLNLDGTYSFNSNHNTYQNIDFGLSQSFMVEIVVTDNYGAIDTDILTINVESVVNNLDKPVITIFDRDTGENDSDYITQDNMPWISGTAVANSKVQLYGNNVLLAETTANINGGWDIINSFVDGNYDIVIKSVESSGRILESEVKNITIDTSMDNPIILKVEEEGIFINLNGNAEANSKIEVYSNEILLTEDLVDNTGSWQIKLEDNLLENNSTIKVKTTDLAGNSAESTSFIFEKELIRPVITIFDRDTGENDSDYITQDNMPWISGTAVANSKVQLYGNNVLLAETTANINGGWDIINSFVDGNYDIVIKSVESSGRILESEVKNITIDTSMDNPIILKVEEEGIFINLNGNAEANSKIEVYSNEILLTEDLVDNTGSWQIKLEDNLLENNSTIKVKTTDLAGNSAESTSFDISNIIQQMNAYSENDSDIQINETTNVIKIINIYNNFD